METLEFEIYDKISKKIFIFFLVKNFIINYNFGNFEIL